MPPLIYKPIQPNLSPSGGDLLGYQEIRPHPALAAYVNCYWQMNTESFAGQVLRYQAVPDGCIDIFLRCEEYEGMFFTGTISSPAQFDLPGYQSYFGIRFLPGAVSRFFDAPLGELLDQTIPFDAVWSARFRELEERLFDTNSTKKRVEIVEAFLTRKLTSGKETRADERFQESLGLILDASGNLNVESELDDVGISMRQLRRIFQRYTGLTPKNFARIIRFQSGLARIQKNQDINWAELALHLGYYDQSHFIAEFKKMSGTRPMEFKQREMSDISYKSAR